MSNTLAILKAGLEQKPLLKQKEDVKIVIAQPKGNIPQQKTKLSIAMDDGLEAIRVLALMKQRKISNVSDKFPQQNVEVMESKAPVVDIKKTNVKKLTQLTGKKIGLEEDFIPIFM